MNFPEVIEYTHNGEKYLAKYDGEWGSDDCLYMVYWQSDNDYWLKYCHHTYKGIQEILNQQTKDQNTMNVTTLKQQLEAAQNEITKLQQAIEKAEAENDVWPKCGDRYWYTNSLGGYAVNTFSKSSNVDAIRIAIGNCYETKEEAEQAVEKMKVMTELKRLADKSWKETGAEINWSDENTSKYCVRYNMEYDVAIIVDNYTVKNINDIYFHSAEKAREAIDKIGEERLKSVFKQN